MMEVGNGGFVDDGVDKVGVGEVKREDPHNVFFSLWLDLQHALVTRGIQLIRSYSTRRGYSLRRSSLNRRGNSTRRDNSSPRGNVARHSNSTRRSYSTRHIAQLFS
ncbi:hypothetical protein Q3G72_017958 [Acer saccharum]|nr:hypothetical protein Q3G72_017958 [Acer saccharum]